MEDLYKTLGVSPSATKAEIRRAYQKLARKYHPDVSTEPNAEEMFKRVRHAYEVLSSSVERSNYDFRQKTSSSGAWRPPPNKNAQRPPHQRSYSSKQPPPGEQPHETPPPGAESSGTGASQGQESRAGYAYPKMTRTSGAIWLIMALAFVLYILGGRQHPVEHTAPPAYATAPYSERANQPSSEPQQPVDSATTLSNRVSTGASPSPSPKQVMSMDEFMRMFPSYAEPTCRSTFRPEVIHKGEQSTFCYSYYGPVYKVTHAASGVLSYMGRHASDFRTDDWPKMGNFMESVLGHRTCGQVEPSKIGKGVKRSTYEGVGGVVTCEATLTVLPPKKAPRKGNK